MSDHSDQEARLLSASEREAVGMTRHPAIAALSLPDLQALAKRLRDTRDRARDIARQQRREMRGKAEARGTTPATDNAGTVGKADVLDLALRRISAQLRRNREASADAVTPAKPTRAGGPSATSRSSSPGGSSPGGVKSLKAATKKPGGKPRLRVDPREIGRVSQAGKVAQARRDSKKPRP